jgi:hypothetical protein
VLVCLGFGRASSFKLSWLTLVLEVKVFLISITASYVKLEEPIRLPKQI